MDDHRPAGAMIDAALDRELEAALAVEPLPGFGARVLARVQRERVAAPSPWRWPIAACFAFGAIIALVVAMSRHDRVQVARDESPRQQPAGAPEAQAIGPGAVAQASAAGQASTARGATTAVRKSARGRSRPGAGANGPELLIAADEARALRQLFSSVQKGLINLSSLQEAGFATTSLQPPTAIAFPPITFEPIAPAAAEEGERQ